MSLPRIFFATAALLGTPLFADDTGVVRATDATPAAPEKPAATATDASVNPPKKPSDNKEISAAELDALLARLAEMRSGLDAAARRAIAEALKAVTPAAAETSKAVALFIESTRAADYDKDKTTKADKPGKPGDDFDTWRKQNEDRLHDAGFASALRIRYRYFKLCLECDTSEKAAAAFPALVTLQGDAITAYASAGQYASVMREDVSSDPAARRFNVGKYKPEGWSGAALDLDGHLGRAVKAALETAPDSVPAIWETRLKLERAFAEAQDKNAISQKRKKQQEQAQQNRRSGNGRGHTTPGRNSDPDAGDDSKSVGDFENVRLPRLLWRMAEDFMKAGLHRRAFETMFNVIMKYPKHPDVGVWVDRMTELAATLKEGGDPGAVEAPAKSSDSSSGARTGRRTRR